MPPFPIAALFLAALPMFPMAFAIPEPNNSHKQLAHRRHKRDFMFAAGNSTDPMPTCFQVKIYAQNHFKCTQMGRKSQRANANRGWENAEILARVLANPAMPTAVGVGVKRTEVGWNLCCQTGHSKWSAHARLGPSNQHGPRVPIASKSIRSYI